MLKYYSWQPEEDEERCPPNCLQCAYERQQEIKRKESNANK